MIIESGSMESIVQQKIHSPAQSTMSIGCGHDDNLHRFKFAHRKRMRNRSCSTYYTLSTSGSIDCTTMFLMSFTLKTLCRQCVESPSCLTPQSLHHFDRLIDWESSDALCVCVCVSRAWAYIELSTSFAYACVMLNLVSRSIAIIVPDLFECQRYKMHSPLTIQLDGRFVDSSSCRFAVNLML